MKKRLLSMLLALCMALGLAACGQQNETPEPTQKPQNTPVATEPPAPVEETEELSPILQRAREYGFVPQELWEEPDRVVTMSELCQMLTGVVALYDENRLPAWNVLAADAMQSDDAVQVDKAILAIFEAAMAMDLHLNEGIGFCREPNWETISRDVFHVEDWWEGLTAKQTADYFANRNDTIIDQFGNESDILLLSALYAEQHKSIVDLSYIFPPTEDWRFPFSENVTRAEAIRAVTVFTESDSLILHHESEYAPLSEVGTYDTSILTQDLLLKETNLPEPQQSALPASWSGAGLASRKDAERPYVPFKESDIRLLSENGFTFTRVFYDFSTMQYPYADMDRTKVNLFELKELDQLIAWGMKYDVHIQITCVGALGYGCQGDKEFDLLSKDEWNLFGEYWEMLTRRYAGIPSTYLSFDLLNEFQPDDPMKYENAADEFGTIADRIWAVDPDRVVLVSFPGNPPEEWVEAVAKQGLALGIHPYTPEFIINRIAEEAYPAEPAWPMPWFPSVMEPEDAITITGEINGGTLLIYFEGAVQEALLEVYVDGVLYETIDPVSDFIDEYGDYREFAEPYRVTIPAEAERLILRSTKDSRWIRFNGLRLERDGEAVGVMPHDYNRFTASGNCTLLVDADGWSNGDGRVFDGEAVYEEAVLPFAELAQENHVGFMANEMGLFGDADIGEVGYAFVDDVLSALNRHGLGWCYCEMDIGYLFSFFGGDFVFGNYFVLSSEDISYETYNYTDGRSESFWVANRMLDVLKQHQ